VVRKILGLSIRLQLLFVFTVSLISAVTLLQWWNYRTFYTSEIDRVADKHLVIAENLSLALSRYSRDLTNGFAIAIAKIESSDNIGMTTRALLSDLKIKRIDVLSGSIKSDLAITLTSEKTTAPPSWDQIYADEPNNVHLGNGVYLTPLLSVADQRVFIMFKELADERIVAASISPSYIKSVQKAITFGELGHSAIFDQTGITIAHPIASMEAKMANASGIPIVAAMLQRRTGVMEFYAPPMKADMIAGYTFVPETGWAVMVPQPIAEISVQVNDTLKEGYLWALLVSIFIASTVWISASRIVKPLHNLANIASSVARDGKTIKIDSRKTLPKELGSLRQAMLDMVERIKLAQAQLHDALRIKTEESKKKTQFLLMTGHELRTPLNGIVGMLEIVRSEEKDNDKRKMLDAAYCSAQHLGDVTSNMMAFAESDSGQFSIAIKPRNVDVALAVENLLLAVQERAQAQGSSVTCEFSNPTNIQVINTDWTRLTQIVWNLSDNAIKHGGAKPWRLSMCIDMPNSTFRLVVQDSGPGISDELQERIWHPYSQGDIQGYKRSTEGLGLGLSVVRQIVDSFDGKTNLESEIDHGTTITVELPINIVKASGQTS
jgi:signal transduction histidine kinase